MEPYVRGRLDGASGLFPRLANDAAYMRGHHDGLGEKVAQDSRLSDLQQQRKELKQKRDKGTGKLGMPYIALGSAELYSIDNQIFKIDREIAIEKTKMAGGG